MREAPMIQRQGDNLSTRTLPPTLARVYSVSNTSQGSLGTRTTYPEESPAVRKRCIHVNSPQVRPPMDRPK